ncbi:GNAT family N-acetyltransferase [Metapseudomonas lalkuanensis]|uniref:GNAT family N-acetyltransferase n=2 Tax=Metapseudomonas lalkuanensis TaxID=2604832 RepID=A0A5J6QG63_9GAMM|nr:GNAT family N-acetyltransferase [Pseudomonas lalkuanensis]
MSTMNYRPLRVPADSERLTAFDASYCTSHIWRVEADGLALRLVEEALPEPFHKAYDANAFPDDVADADFALAAEARDGSLAGFACVRLVPWNRSAELSALFVAPKHQGQGIGRTLLGGAMTYARSQAMRCLWLETQTSNHPAIGFYQRAGFTFCGLNTMLYDPTEVAPEEVALYLSHPLNG